jgi:cell division protein FtsI/penicillin-binding protein 2
MRFNPWKEPTYADSTEGDYIDGEDLEVRRAAVAALGPYNGSVVVTDPANGRILSIVNQKLAFKSGFQPCSTIKLIAALSALREGIIEKDTPMRLGRISMSLINALARSNNPFFANLGIKLGFDRVMHYARLFGLGEKAGWGIEEEREGTLPPVPPKWGGVGMMTSFGSGISLTPLQLASFLSSIANGGTLYWLQYPRNQQEVHTFEARVKRELDIAEHIPDMKEGMKAVVDIGTGRRAGYDRDEPVMGKTGTCTDSRTPTHLGWFGSFNEVGERKLVVVVLLTGGKPVNGPVAAGVAGNVYKRLSESEFFSRSEQPRPPAVVSSLVSTGVCCAQ